MAEGNLFDLHCSLEGFSDFLYDDMKMFDCSETNIYMNTINNEYGFKKNKLLVIIFVPNLEMFISVNSIQ